MNDITVVISTHNRGHLLEHNLRRMKELTLPEEIIVVDDGGDDNTQEICDASEIPQLRYIYNNNPGLSVCSLGRNIGIREATSKWIVVTEPEIYLSSDAIAQFKELILKYPERVICSAGVWFCPEDFFPYNFNVTPECHLGYVPDLWWVAPYLTMLGDKEWLESIGGFDEGFPGDWGMEDEDFYVRARMVGRTPYKAHEIRAFHLWHPSRADGDGGIINAEYYMQKGHATDQADFSEVVANKDREWGRIK